MTTDTLTVVDNPTEKSYELPVEHGAIRRSGRGSPGTPRAEAAGLELGARTRWSRIA
jgi:hypothetical protein